MEELDIPDLRHAAGTGYRIAAIGVQDAVVEAAGRDIPGLLLTGDRQAGQEAEETEEN
jgi:hypothetical protein